MLADANFGIFAERDLEIAKDVERLQQIIQTVIIDDLTVQYTKNATDVVFDITKALGPYDRRGVTVECSIHEPTNSSRNQKAKQ